MKYKLQENGVLDTELNQSIPESVGNRHWQEYQVWLADGNTPDPQFTAQELSDQARAYKIQELKDEGLGRIQAVMPAISSFDMLELVREQWLSTAVTARNATATFQSVIDIYQAARNGVVFLNAATDGEVTSYDIGVDPSWPV